MPYIFLDLQLFADEGMADTVDLASPIAENVSSEGVATGSDTEQIATAPGDESWDSLIRGKYKNDYDQSVKDAISKRFKNQRDLQCQIDMINPMMQQLAARYNVALNADGSIPIDALTQKVMDDNSMYEQEAFDKGMSVADLKQMKALERENQLLKNQNARTEQDREWQKIVEQGERLKEMYPDFDLDVEMDDPSFGRLFASLNKSGFPDALQRAYEVVHKDQIIGGAMSYGVQKAQQKLSQSVQANMARPSENGVSQQSSARIGQVDPSRLTKAQIQELRMRAERGERITFG